MGKGFRFTIWITPRLLMIGVIMVILTYLSEIIKVFNTGINLFLAFGITETISEISSGAGIIRKIWNGVRGIKEHEDYHKPDITFKLIQMGAPRVGNGFVTDWSNSFALFVLNQGKSGHGASDIKIVLNGNVIKRPHIEIKHKKTEGIDLSNMEIIRSYNEDSTEMPHLDSNEYFSIGTYDNTIIQYKSEAKSQYCSCIKLHEIERGKGKYKTIVWEEIEHHGGQLVNIILGKMVRICNKCPNKKLIKKVK